MAEDEAQIKILLGQVVKLNERMQAMENAKAMRGSKADSNEDAAEAVELLVEAPYWFGQREAQFLVVQHGAVAVLAADEITRREDPQNPKPYFKRVVSRLKGERGEGKGGGAKPTAELHVMAWENRWAALVAECGSEKGAQLRCADLKLARVVASDRATAGQRRLWERIGLLPSADGPTFEEVMKWKGA